MADTPTGTETLTDQAVRNHDAKGVFFEATYGGALSFCRRPYMTDAAHIGDADVVVFGVPFDSAVTNRPGARLGPRAIRQASTQLAELDSHAWGFNPFTRLAVVDAGDLTLNPHDPMTIADQISGGVAPFIDTGAFPLALGGDHFIAYPLIRALAERHGPLALLQFDAHADTWDSLGPLDHGTMFKRAINEGLINVDHSIQIGLRTHTDHDFGIEQIPAHECHEIGPKNLLDRILARIGNAKTYLSFDIDCLDPAFAPGTGTFAVVGGLASWQILPILRGLGPLNLKGMDVVEVSHDQGRNYGPCRRQLCLRNHCDEGGDPMTNPLWTPSAERIANANLTAFMAQVGQPDFASRMPGLSLQQGRFIGPYDFFDVLGDPGGPAFQFDGGDLRGTLFPEAHLSYAENMLTGDRHNGAGGLALLTAREDGQTQSYRWDELRQLTARYQALMIQAGVGVGDRVAAMIPIAPMPSPFYALPMV